MKKTSLLILCLAVISRLGAAEPSAPAAAPVQPPVAAPAVSPAQVELARQVIKATQFDRIFDQMGMQMQQMATQQMNFSAPNQTPTQKEAALKNLGEVTKLSMDAAKSMLEKVDVIYAEVYSEAELKAMLAFFQSNEGKSMLQKQPQVMQHMMPLVQGMQRELMPKIQALVEKSKTAAGIAAPAGLTPSPLPSSGSAGPAPSPASAAGPTPTPAPATTKVTPQ